MKPKLYIGTIGMSVWFSDDLGITWVRPNSEHGLNNECRVWAIASHPDITDSILAGTDRGLYRWDESQQQWNHLPSPMDGVNIWALQFAPHDARIVIAGVSPGALFKSVDAGRTWRRLSLQIPEICMFNLTSRITQVQFDPIDVETIWACVEIDAVHRSRDGGETWTRLSNGLTTDDVHGIAIMQEGDHRVVLAAVNRGVHRSEDDGETFTPVELPTPWQYTRAIAAKAGRGGARDGTVFVTNGDGPPGSWGRLFRSKDFGRSWHELALPGERNSTLWTISVHPHDPELVLVCSNLGQIYLSQDGGDTWKKLTRELGEIRCAHWRPVA